MKITFPTFEEFCIWQDELTHVVTLKEIYGYLAKAHQEEQNLSDESFTKLQKENQELKDRIEELSSKESSQRTATEKAHLPRKEVINFANAMEEVLKKNDYKNHWSNCSQEYLSDKLKEEYEEVLNAYIFQSSDLMHGKTELMNELLDLANVCMMLWDNTKKILEGQEGKRNKLKHFCDECGAELVSGHMNRLCDTCKMKRDGTMI